RRAVCHGPPHGIVATGMCQQVLGDERALHVRRLRSTGGGDVASAPERGFGVPVATGIGVDIAWGRRSGGDRSAVEDERELERRGDEPTPRLPAAGLLQCPLPR